MSGETLKDLDNLIEEFFSVFDNRGGAVPDLSRLHGICLPGAVFTNGSGDERRPMSLQDFVAPREALLSGGALRSFHEWETESKTFFHGTSATRVSHYRKEGVLEGKAYSGVGMKSFQILLVNGEWKILSVLWEDQGEG